MADLDETTVSFRRVGMMWSLDMYTIAKRADLLQFYLDLNSGGVVHSDDELERVRGLRDQALVADAAVKAEPAKPTRRAPRA